jgi:hypothetical protein
VVAALGQRKSTHARVLNVKTGSQRRVSDEKNA